MPPSGAHDQGMPSKQQPSQQPMGKEGEQGQMGKEGQQGQMGGAGTEVMAERMSATATVEKVDMAKRKLTLKNEQGQTFKVDIPASIKNANKIKKGDKINLDYYSSVTLSLHKQEPGGKAPSAEETEMGARTAAKLPGGVVAKEVTASAEVTKVDAANNMITLKLPGGDTDTIHVTDPQLQSKLSDIKVGDRIRAKYTEAVAITVTPPEKNKG
jgi:Cu/Ag efflux protein CusF